MAIEIVDFPMKNGDFPLLFVCSPEGKLASNPSPSSSPVDPPFERGQDAAIAAMSRWEWQKCCRPQLAAAQAVGWEAVKDWIGKYHEISV